MKTIQSKVVEILENVLVSGVMVLGAPRASNPLDRSAKPGGGSIPLAPFNNHKIAQFLTL